MKSNHKGCLNLIVKRFGRLLVVERGEDKIYENTGKHKTRWLCNCDCGTKNKLIIGTSLTSGAVKSCGCLHRKISREMAKNSTHKKKYNKYDLSGSYGIGYTTNGDEFYFDLEDYDKIKDICWHKSRGYIVGHYMDRDIRMSRLIMNVIDDLSIVVDHINSDHKNDNRKSNLRITTQHKNTFNRKRPSNNTSGRKGVSWDKSSNKWMAYIKFNDKRIHLGRYSNKEDAIKAREEAEEKYFKEYKYIGENP